MVALASSLAVIALVVSSIAQQNDVVALLEHRQEKPGHHLADSR
jgi:hypothetical protein